ncbi:MAG: ATPase [Clostridiaceae bacterium]|nr:ATPase [Clostridiaceae bacterium]
MVEGRIRHMFPGGNTPLGFYSYYKYIINIEEANRIFILKGGPGTGKSTIMKKIGLDLAKQGYDIEFMHCSSDNNSLDGIVVPKLSVAIIDGTAPHVVDPVCPGAVDEIINLGEFWNQDGIIESKEEILKTGAKIRDCFERAYRYLRAAAQLKADTEKIFEYALDKGKEAIFIHDLKAKIFGSGIPAKTPGKQRLLFASAITPKGPSEFLDSLCIDHKVIRLCAPSGISTENVLKCIKDEAVNRGFFIETYFCSMSPERIEHIVLPELKISVITANEYHDISDITSESNSTYFMNDFFNSDIISDFKRQLDFNRLYTDTIIQKAVESIALAKSFHDELEKYYINNIDFDRLTLLRENIKNKILSYA